MGWGLYGKKVRHDLDTIRDIRNDFAHSLDKFDAEHPVIRSRVLGLHALQNVPDAQTLRTTTLLKNATERLAMLLIVLMAPSQSRFDPEMLTFLDPLDFQAAPSVKLRDSNPT